MADQSPAPPAPQIVFMRTDTFSEIYANNVRFESNVWDLRLVFGTLDQGTGTTAFDQAVKFHTAISVPWQQIKIMSYMLQLNLLFHEHANGKVRVHANVVPPPIETALPNLAEQPGGKELLEQIEKLRAELL
jgi:hypothetical protein